MLWFLKTDPRVPKHIRDEMAPYGFCKDEWADNNHWPYYLYIRAARRMQGEVVLTEADIIEDRDKEDVIHIGSHFIDCHHAARYAVDSGHIINEGRIWKQGAAVRHSLSRHYTEGWRVFQFVGASVRLCQSRRLLHHPVGTDVDAPGRGGRDRRGDGSQIRTIGADD